MRLKWKIFLAMLLVVLLLFSLCAAFFISATFNSSLFREEKNAESQNQLVRSSLAVFLSSLPKAEWEDEKAAVEKIMKELAAGPGREMRLRIRNRTEILFENQGCPEKPEGELPGEDVLYQSLEKTEQGYWICTVSPLSVDGTDIFLESFQNVDEIFLEREEQYRMYRLMVLGAAGATALVSFFVASWIAGPVSRLSKVARRIARGELEARAKVRRKDELGGLAVDINEMAERLEDDIERLKSVNERQKRFIGNFAHELKTPLTSIIGYADMLRLRKNNPEFTMEAAGYIFSEGKRLEHLSAKLLEIILLKQEKAEKKPVPVRPLFDRVIKLSGPALEEKRLDVTAEAEETAILGDEELLESVLLNLVDNARKACEKGGHIRLRAWEEGENVWLEVRDDGRGVEPSELHKLTEEFYMEDKSRSRKQGGAGLGLSICREIVRLHQGEMIFQSRKGEGMEVRVRLKGGQGR